MLTPNIILIVDPIPFGKHFPGKTLGVCAACADYSSNTTSVPCVRSRQSGEEDDLILEFYG